VGDRAAVVDRGGTLSSRLRVPEPERSGWSPGLAYRRRRDHHRRRVSAVSISPPSCRGAPAPTSPSSPQRCNASSANAGGPLDRNRQAGGAQNERERWSSRSTSRSEARAGGPVSPALLPNAFEDFRGAGGKAAVEQRERADRQVEDDVIGTEISVGKGSSDAGAGKVSLIDEGEMPATSDSRTGRLDERCVALSEP
jgi:hypothetical protein